MSSSCWSTGFAPLDEECGDGLRAGSFWVVVGHSGAGVTRLVNAFATSTPGSSLVVNGHHERRPPTLGPDPSYESWCPLPRPEEDRWPDSAVERSDLLVLDTWDEQWPADLWTVPDHLLVQHARHLRTLARRSRTCVVLTDRRPSVGSAPAPFGAHRTDNALLDVADVYLQVHSTEVHTVSLTVTGRGLRGWVGAVRHAAGRPATPT